MNILNKNFQEFLKLLIEKDVKFLVVGGYAVGMHGFPRYTGDLDIFIAVSTANAKKIKDVFDAFGFVSLDLSQADFEQEDIVIEIGREPNKIQVLTGIDAVEFDHCWASRWEVDFNGMLVPFINLDDLIKNKEGSGRGKDLIDLIELKKIKKSKDEQNETH